MNRFLILFFILLPTLALSQNYQYIGTTQNIVKARGGLMPDSAFYTPPLATLSDTSGITSYDKLGKQIFINDIGRIYFRDTISTGGKKWTLLSIQTLVNDLGRLPVIKENYPAQGISASGSTVTNYPITALDSSLLYLTTVNNFSSGTKYGGVLWNTPLTDSALVSGPFGLLIGSSFDEGHSSLHGRLHPNGVATFDWTYPDSVGQMSYHLRQLTNMRWYNHGIGGQTSTQVRIRWARDVLGQTLSVDIDGRGTKTISRRPLFIIYDGIGNDPYTAGMTPQISMDNLRYFAQSCFDNGIKLIICNSPQGPNATVAGNVYLATVNKWLESGELDAYNVSVFDLKTYWSNPAYGYDGIHGNPALINPVDGIHFTKAGYDSLSHAIFNTCKLPIVTKVAFINKLDPVSPPSNYAYVDSLTISGIPYKLTKQSDTLNIISPLVTDSIWITAKHITTVNGAGTIYGYSHIYWVLDNNISNDSFYTRRTQGSNGANSQYMKGASLNIIPETYNSNAAVLDIRGATLALDNHAMTVHPAGAGGYTIFNGGTSTTQINNGTVSIYNTATGLGMNGNIKATGTSHLLGVLEVQQNGTPGATGFGISAANTASSITMYGTPQKNKDLIRITTWNGSNINLGSTHTNILALTATGFANPDAANEVGNALSITPQINDTATFHTGIHIRGIYYNPILTSLVNVRHFGVWVGRGNNYFNVKGDSTCFGCDSSTFVNARFRVNGSVRLDTVNAPPSTYNVLVHGLTDSIVYQVPTSSLFTFNSGLTNTSGTVRWNGTLLESPTIDGGSSFSPTFTSTRTGTNGTVTINNTSTGRGINVSSGAGVGIRSVGTTGIGVQGVSTDNYGLWGQSSTAPGLYTLSSAASGAQLQTNPTSTNNNQVILELYRLSQSAGANNISGSIDFYINNTAASGTTVLANQLISKLPTATSTSETSQFILKGINAGSQNTLATFDGNANATFGTTNSIVGTATNNNAVAGNIGEEISSYKSIYANYTTTATYQASDSITLTAGDWDISAVGSFSGNGATLTAGSDAIFVISTTINSPVGSTEGKNIVYVSQTGVSGTNKQSVSIAPFRVSLSATTTYYLNTQATFTAGNPQFATGIRARRIR